MPTAARYGLLPLLQEWTSLNASEQQKRLNVSDMILQIDREKKLILLKWLRQGYIDTLDMPDAYNGGNLFLELLKESSIEESDEESSDTE